MCDTILAPPSSTAAATMLFGKNSDRQRNEAQVVQHISGSEYPPNSSLQCTYITIPQVQRTHAVLICRPYWMWGAEMGANEYGVVIGNEALTARSPSPEEPALVGMDLLRLALERASTAAQAIDVITTLLERHGQGGNCGHLTPTYYNNGFMVADANEAFVLETIGREWLLERIRGVRAISNGYSIARGAQRVSAGLNPLVRDSGWSIEADPDYAEVLADPEKQHIGSATARRESSTSLLRARDRHLGVADMMSILRDHGSGDRYHSEWRDECVSKRTLCLHASGDRRSGQTVGSMVSELRDRESVHWVTATAAPCISLFKPVLIDVPLPAHGPSPTDRFDSRALWWRHELLHRAAMGGDVAKFIDDIRSERDALETQFRDRVNAVLAGGSIDDRSRVVAECWKNALAMESRWYTQIDVPYSTENSPDRYGWTKMNELADIDWRAWGEPVQDSALEG